MGGGGVGHGGGQTGYLVSLALGRLGDGKSQRVARGTRGVALEVDIGGHTTVDLREIDTVEALNEIAGGIALLRLDDETVGVVLRRSAHGGQGEQEGCKYFLHFCFCFLLLSD